MSASSSLLASEAAFAKGFTGENEDGREYKRWKTWVKNKLLTLDKLPDSSRGAYIYTLLGGKALEAVEHLEPEAYQKKDGDAVLWALLDKRFPQQEVVDELGEILGEVFGLRSQEGENMKQRGLHVPRSCSTSATGRQGSNFPMRLGVGSYCIELVCLRSKRQWSSPELVAISNENR